MTLQDKMHDTQVKLSIYAKRPGSGFTVSYVASERTLTITPQDGTPMRLTRQQAEAWLSGYVTGRRTTVAPTIDNSPEAVAARRAMFKGFGW